MIKRVSRHTHRSKLSNGALLRSTFARMTAPFNVSISAAAAGWRLCPGAVSCSHLRLAQTIGKAVDHSDRCGHLARTLRSKA